eukprot:Selendium_serpulae@DN6291_c0_g1_i2.p2
MAQKTPVTIGYWNIRGLLEPLRLLCEYADQPYTVETHSKYSDWIEKKKTMPPMANLPYMYDGELFLVQSNAILRHLGRKNGLLGGTPEDQARLDMVADEVMDLRNPFVDLVYRSGKGDEFLKAAKTFQRGKLQA